MFFFLILPSLSPSSLKFSHSSIQHLPIPLALLMESRHPRRRSLASLPDGVLLMVAMHVASSSPKPFADIGNLKLSTFRQVTSDRMVERCIAVDREYDRMTWGGLERKERYIAFVRRCSDAGNSEANCILGVQLLSTHGERYAGISRLLGAKESGHEAAAYILGMLYFQEVDTRVVGVELLNMLATGCSSCNCIRGTEPGCLILHCRRKTTSLSWCKTFWKLPNDMSLSFCANAACGRVIGSAWMPDDELRRTFWSPLCRYVSVADIVDLSSLVDYGVKIIDFRVFASLWCGINVGKSCFGSLCCALSSATHSSSDSPHCRSLLAGLQGNVDLCTHAVQEDCRTTVWIYQQDRDGMLDSFQPTKDLQKKRKTSYIRKRRDVFKAFGTSSIAGTATVLSFGSLFSSPYRGSELHIDIRESLGDSRIQSLLQKIEFLPFVPEILGAGKEFALNRIKEPFLCAQLRLLDGQFKNKWRATFSALEEKVKYLQLEFKRNKASGPINIFIMTDLPTANWTGTYLSDLAKDTDSFRLYTLQKSDEIIVQSARRLMEAEHGLKSGFFPGNLRGMKEKSACEPVSLPDILLPIEETVCSCAGLGFVGTAGSTIAQSIELMVRNKVCKL